MTERWRGPLRRLDEVAPDERMLRERVRLGPRMAEPSPSTGTRVVAVIFALIVAIGGTALAIRALGPGRISAGSGTSTYTDPLGWIVDVPVDWEIADFNYQGRVSYSGAQFSNVTVALPVATPSAPGQTDGAVFPPAGVALTITHRVGGPAPDSQAELPEPPLSIEQFVQRPPGSSTADFLAFAVDGVPLVATIRTGPDASAHDVALIDAMVASIRSSADLSAPELVATLDAPEDGSIPGLALTYGGERQEISAQSADWPGVNGFDDLLFSLNKPVPVGTMLSIRGDALSVDGEFVVLDEQGRPTGIGLPLRRSQGGWALPPEPGSYGMRLTGTWSRGTAGFNVILHVDPEDGVSPGPPASNPILLVSTQRASGDDALLEGELALRNGCVGVQNGEVFTYLIWPAGTSLTPPSEPLTVVDRSGAEIASIGDTIRMGGGVDFLGSAEGVVDGGIPPACAEDGEHYWYVGQVEQVKGAPSSGASPAEGSDAGVTYADLKVQVLPGIGLGLVGDVSWTRDKPPPESACQASFSMAEGGTDKLTFIGDDDGPPGNDVLIVRLPDAFRGATPLGIQCGGGLTLGSTRTSTLHVGDAFGDFQGLTLNSSALEEARYRRASFPGELEIAFFWASWLPGSQEYLASLEQIDVNNDQISVLGVDVHDDDEAARAAMDAAGAAFITVVDRSGELARRFGIYSMPVAVAVDGQTKKVVAVFEDASPQELEAFVSNWLSSDRSGTP